MVPGQWNAYIDGEWVEVTVDSVIGQHTIINEDGTISSLPFKDGYRGDETKKNGIGVSSTDLETGFYYIKDIIWRDKDGNEFNPEEVEDIMPYFKYYGIDHSLPFSTFSPTPTPSVRLIKIEISP